MTYHAPPIVKMAERMLFEIEQAVRGFSRFDKYQTGKALRDQARVVLNFAHRSSSEPERRRQLVNRLSHEIDMLKSELQTASSLRAFRSRNKFEELARLAKELGAQAGGWKKDLHRNVQNAVPPSSDRQRAQTLSTQAASREANP